jgi:para-nitrobenzyl esterase
MNESAPAIITVSDGRLEGAFRDGLYLFKGIPYAAPPTGDRRWLPPQPVEPWTGIRPAKETGAICIQPVPPVPPPGMLPEEEPQSEDCLFLNVLTPGLDGAHRPVMVWIHGGAFTMGSGSQAMFDGSGLAKKGNVVFVSLNYRLGEFGFLRLKEITGGAVPATGNEGLLDQIAALQWVRKNIAAFGGDPDNVTVFGESAGAMSIGCLMAMPAAKGLFRKAILESGVGSTAVPEKRATEVAEKLLKILGVDPRDAAALRKITPQRILEADEQLRQPTAPGGAVRLTVMAPVIDGETIPDVTNEMAKRGAARDVVALVGTNLDEYRLFTMMEPPDFDLNDAALTKRLDEFLAAEDIPRVVAAYRQSLEGRGEIADNRNVWSAIQTDMMFRIPAVELLEAQTAHGQKVYSYLFTWRNPNGNPLGACHAIEIGFVFGQYEPLFCGTGPDADRLSECVQDAWLSFAHHGDPSGECMGQWPPYGTERNTMLLGKDSRVEAAPYDDVRAIWETVTVKKSPLP